MAAFCWKVGVVCWKTAADRQCPDKKHILHFGIFKSRHERKKIKIVANYVSHIGRKQNQQQNEILVTPVDNSFVNRSDMIRQNIAATVELDVAAKTFETI